MMRGLKSRLIDELNTGKLTWFLTEVKDNPTLALTIRENFVQLYYRGAEVLKIQYSAGFKFSVDEKYFIAPELALEYEPLKRDARAYGLYQRKFSTLTTAVDSWLEENKRDLQEKQQDVFRENGHIIDMNFLPTDNENTCDLVAVDQGKVILSPFFCGQVPGDVVGQYQIASDILSSSPELLETSTKNIMSNLVAMGLIAEELPCEGVELIYVLVGCDKAAATQTLQGLQGSVSFKVLFLEESETNIDYSKAESL